MTDLEKQLRDALAQAEQDLRAFGGTTKKPGGEIIPVPEETARRWFPYLYAALDAAKEQE